MNESEYAAKLKSLAVPREKRQSEVEQLLLKQQECLKEMKESLAAIQESKAEDKLNILTEQKAYLDGLSQWLESFRQEVKQELKATLSGIEELKVCLFSLVFSCWSYAQTLLSIESTGISSQL